MSRRTTWLLVLCSLTICSNSFAQIKNPGFENRFNDWTDRDPSAISSVERSGSRSAKISGSAGRVSQDVSVEPNTNYVLTAYIRGSGKIGAVVGGNASDDRIENASSWQKAEVAFNSGNQTSAEIFAAYYSGQGRFDDFSLQQVSSDNPDAGDNTGGNPECSGTDNLAISNASDDGSNDGNIPANTIDNNLNTRWSSRGDGKSLSLNLGEIASVREVKIAWYRGSQRVANFDIETSINQSNWTTVLAGGQSFRNSGLETYNVTE